MKATKMESSTFGAPKSSETLLSPFHFPSIFLRLGRSLRSQTCQQLIISRVLTTLDRLQWNVITHLSIHLHRFVMCAVVYGKFFANHVPQVEVAKRRPNKMSKVRSRILMHDSQLTKRIPWDRDFRIQDSG